jgi:hypothetical protein
MIKHSTAKQPAYFQIPDGQERLATKSERDDVTRKLDKHGVAQTTVAPVGMPDRRECGDEVNRFLLCRMVNDASRHIKANAERSGETIPMTTIVRGVLRSFRVEALDKDGPLTGSVLDIPALTTLNSKVMRGEIARYDRARAKRNESKSARADRPSDNAQATIENAIKWRERLADAPR